MEVQVDGDGAANVLCARTSHQLELVDGLMGDLDELAGDLASQAGGVPKSRFGPDLHLLLESRGR